MSEETQEQGKVIPAWKKEYFNKAYMDEESIWTYDDLPEGVYWPYAVRFQMAVEALRDVSIETLADCKLLEEILERYHEDMKNALGKVYHQIIQEYRKVKEAPCTICQTRAITDKFLHICAECKNKYAGEAQLVRIHLYRARKAKLEATLTFSEWIATLTRFNWKCAYNENHPYEVLEHFIPISQGGGTTQENCVPSCRPCNASKGKKHPELVTK